MNKNFGMISFFRVSWSLIKHRETLATAKEFRSSSAKLIITLFCFRNVTKLLMGVFWKLSQSELNNLKVLSNVLPFLRQISENVALFRKIFLIQKINRILEIIYLYLYVGVFFPGSQKSINEQNRLILFLYQCKYKNCLFSFISTYMKK